MIALHMAMSDDDMLRRELAEQDTSAMTITPHGMPPHAKPRQAAAGPTGWEMQVKEAQAMGWDAYALFGEA